MTRSRFPSHLAFTVALAFATALVPNAPALTLHIAPDGNDQWSGQMAKPNRAKTDGPLASLGGARDAIRRLKAAAPLHEPVRVLIADGLYTLREPVVFGPPDSGSQSAPITFEAAPGAKPVFSGGQRIIGWRKGPDGTWDAAVPEAKDGRWVFRELFVNGERRPRARHPDEGWLRIEKAGADRRTSFTFKPGDLRTVPDADRVELLFLHDWSVSRIRVKAIDEASRTLTTAFPIGHSAPHYAIDHFEPNPRYCLENSRAWLDAPGEWHLDTAQGVLSYLPKPGERVERLDIAAPRATALLIARGDERTGEPVRHLHFRGLAFEHCAWLPPEQGYAEGQATFHEPRGSGTGMRAAVPAALQFELAEHCSFTGGRIAHMGGAGIHLGSRTRHCRLADTRISDISGNGVMLGEDTSRRVNNQAWWQAAPDQAAASNEVRRCVIERCGGQFYGAVGVWAGLTRGMVIAENEIRDLPYTGVSLGWIWNPTPSPAGGNLVESNHIHHVMQQLSDGGGIYTLGRQPGTVLRRNRIHDVPVNIGRAESNGMFLDEGTTDIVIEENDISNVARSPLRFHKATTNLVRRNRLTVLPGVPPIRYNSTKEEDIRQEDNEVVIRAQ